MATRDGLYQHFRRDGTWVYYTQFRTSDGRHHRRTTGTRNKREAAKEARRIKAEEEIRVGKTPVKRRTKDRLSPTLENLSSLDLVAHENRGVSQIHYDREESRWGVILDRVDPLTHPADISHDWLLEYEGLRRREGRRGKTIREEFKAIKRALRIAIRRRWLVELPEWPKVRSDPKDTRRAGKLRPPAMLAEFIAALHRDAQDEAVVAMLTGLRSAELKRIQADWVEPAPKGSETPALLRIPDWAAKTRRSRVVGLPERALLIIRRRLEDDPEREFIFSQSDFKKHRQAVTRRLFGEKEPNITLRDLRHTYATLALRETGDAAGVMDALGHRDLRTTQIYISSPLERTAGIGAAVERLLRDPEEGRDD